MQEQDLNRPTIYIWHHPGDADYVKKLVKDLRMAGITIHHETHDSQKGGNNFRAIEWWLGRIDWVVFILSARSTNGRILNEDVKKVLRQKNLVIIPVIIDDEGAQEVPVSLRFIKPLDFRFDYDRAYKILLNGIKNRAKSANDLHERKFSKFLKPAFWIAGHFRRYLTLPPLTFCWQITVENLLVSLTATGLVLFFFQTGTRTNLENLSAVQFFWLVIIVGPIFETIALQMLPVFIAKRIGLGFFGQIALSVVPFAALHFSRSIGTGIGAGIIGGFYSAFTYVHWRQYSYWTAFWVTALSHGLYNFGIFAMIIGDF